MREKDILKQALASKLPDKEKIRNACLESSKIRKGNIKRVIVIAACLILVSSVMFMLPLLVGNDTKKPVPEVIDNSDTLVVNSPVPESDHEKDTDNAETVDTADESFPVREDPPAIGGGGKECKLHNLEYHGIPGSMIDYVGEEAFDEWRAQFLDEEGNYIKDEETNCWGDFNIVEFIKYFDIPDEVIIDAYPGYYISHSAYWDPDLLLKRDAEAYEQFARKTSLTPEEEKEYKERGWDQSMKWRILDILKEKKDKRSVDFYNRITCFGTKYLFEEFSVLDIVENSSVTLEDIDSSFGIDPRRTEYGPYYDFRYVYNFDLLFDERAALYAEIEKLEDIPYVPRAAQIDKLLRIGYNGELTVKEEAVETAYGIYIPEGYLPQNDEDLPMEKDFILYDGRIYWYTERVSASEEHLREVFESTIPVGHTWGDIEKGKTNWNTYRYYHFASGSRGDVYHLKDYDPEFRIALNNYYQDNTSMRIYEANRGITLKKGSDLFGNGALDVLKNADSVLCGEKTIDDPLTNRLLSLLDSSTFVLDGSDIGSCRSLSLTIKMRDLSTVSLTLYENGYLEYSEISGYGVYLRIEDESLIKALFE